MLTELIPGARYSTIKKSLIEYQVVRMESIRKDKDMLKASIKKEDGQSG